MRCKNCGWDNPDQNHECEKCGAPLMGAAEAPAVGNPMPNHGPTIRETPTPAPPHIGATISEGQMPQAQPQYTPNPQPQYQPAAPQPAPEPVHRPTVNNAGAGFGGTIPPWMQGGSQVGYCLLTPMENMPGERHMPKEVELKGDYIELNRNNTDPDNGTISQKVQAIITHENGQRYIKDESAYKTTYIYAGEKTPIKSGDVILMGSRRFIFTEE